MVPTFQSLTLVAALLKLQLQEAKRQSTSLAQHTVLYVILQTYKVAYR